jgi:hypothetical protein
MPRRDRLLVVPLIVLILASAIAARDKRARIDSRWPDPPIAIDGSSAEWPGPLTRFNEQPLSMGAANDGEFLYLVVTASDRTTRFQILRRGLIVWFDAAGGDKKRFGIKFPIGAGLTEEDLRGRRGRGEPPPDEREPPSKEGREQGPPDRTIEPPNRLEVYLSKDDARSFTADKAPGIEVKLGQAEGVLTYELKVPIESGESHPYAINAKAGAAIGVGLEMPKLEMPEGRGRDEGGVRGPGAGGMGGRGIGGIGGMGGGGRRGGDERGGFEQPKPISGWVTVQLVAKK